MLRAPDAGPPVVIGEPRAVVIAPGRFVHVQAQQDRTGHVTVVVRDGAAAPLLELEPLRAQELAFALERIVSSLGVRR